jgi:hypothetical protein
MSNLFVRNLPSIKEREFKYRSRTSSEQLNEMQQEAFNDILDLFNKANQLQKTVYEMNLANNIESVCYSKRLEEAVTKLNKLTELYNNLTSTEEDFRTISKFAFEAETNSTGYNAVVDQNTNDIVAHIVNSTSKTRLYDETYGEVLVPPSLQAYIGPDDFRVGGNIYSIEDSDINNAFDGSDSSVWFRKVITSPDVEFIENELVIGLPEDIITTRLMNQVIVKTFPVGFVDILDIKYKSNGAWQTIPGFEEHYGCEEYQDTDIFGNTYTYHSINNASNLKFNFQNLQTNQIKIKLRQRNYEYDAENNRRIWYFGLRDVDVIYNIYTRDYSEFEMVYDFPETSKVIKVYNSEVFFNNAYLTDDKNFGVSKEYFYYDNSGNTHKIPSTCPFILDGHKLMVRYTIEGNQTTPNIYMCNIKYKLV